MFLFCKHIIFTVFLLILYRGESQNLENKDFDSILKSELSNIQKQKFVDSIAQLKNYPEERLSYLYHTYARNLSKIKKGDDFVFQLDSHSLKKIGSQGQQKTFLIALKLHHHTLPSNPKHVSKIHL